MRRKTFSNSVPAQPAGWLLLAALAAFAGWRCTQPESPSSHDAAPSAAIEVLDARASLTGSTGALYMTIVNRSDHADRLLGVTTSAARVADPHESLEEGGVVRMVARPDGFEIPPQGRLVLEPGGRHVMLMDPVPAPAGELLSFALKFEMAGEVKVQAAVVDLLGGHRSVTETPGEDHRDAVVGAEARPASGEPQQTHG